MPCAHAPGFTLIELLVAMALGALLLTGLANSARVFEECVREVRDGDEIDTGLREQRRDLLDLVRVPRREDEARQSPSAAFWSPMSWRIPAVPSSSSVSSAVRWNGSPSAVPWISTKRPLSVITRFMSTTAEASSP